MKLMTAIALSLLVTACRSETAPLSEPAAETGGGLRPLVFEGAERLDEGLRRAVHAWAEQASKDGRRLGLEGVNTPPSGPVIVALRERRGEGPDCRESLVWLGFSHTADDARMTAIPARRFGHACCPGQTCTPDLGGHHLATIDAIRRRDRAELAKRLPEQGSLRLEYHPEGSEPIVTGRGI